MAAEWKSFNIMYLNQLFQIIKENGVDIGTNLVVYPHGWETLKTVPTRIKHVPWTDIYSIPWCIWNECYRWENYILWVNLNNILTRTRKKFKSIRNCRSLKKNWEWRAKVPYISLNTDPGQAEARCYHSRAAWEILLRLERNHWWSGKKLKGGWKRVWLRILEPRLGSKSRKYVLHLARRGCIHLKITGWIEWKGSIQL